jgi:hypothetical protein
MIDRTKKKKKEDELERAQTEILDKKDIEGEYQNDEISPSWFNIQNQRYDC